MATADQDKPHFQPFDVLTPDEVRVALEISGADKWEDVKARIPWSDQLGARTLRIQWSDLLEWLRESRRKVA